MLCGQSKLKLVVANQALQCVKTVQAVAIKEFNNCNLELIQLFNNAKSNTNNIANFDQIKEK